MLYNNPRNYAKNMQIANNRNINIITNQLNHQTNSSRNNPEEPQQTLSPRKVIPKNSDVIRERSEMIIHTR